MLSFHVIFSWERSVVLSILLKCVSGKNNVDPVCGWWHLIGVAEIVTVSSFNMRWLTSGAAGLFSKSFRGRGSCCIWFVKWELEQWKICTAGVGGIILGKIVLPQKHYLILSCNLQCSEFVRILQYAVLLYIMQTNHHLEQKDTKITKRHCFVLGSPGSHFSLKNVCTTWGFHGFSQSLHANTVFFPVQYSCN